MSGPKVVRVRTREERTAECLVMIDSLQAAIEQLEAFERHHDCSRTELSAKRATVLADLKSKVAAGLFEQVERTVPKERQNIIFVREEVERTVLETSCRCP
jgi:hypothetical protein